MLGRVTHLGTFPTEWVKSRQTGVERKNGALGRVPQKRSSKGSSKLCQLQKKERGPQNQQSKFRSPFSEITRDVRRTRKPSSKFRDPTPRPYPKLSMASPGLFVHASNTAQGATNKYNMSHEHAARPAFFARFMHQAQLFLRQDIETLVRQTFHNL